MAQDVEKLQNRLDSLWSIYLDHLDAYDRAQEAIQKHFSRGFFDLALANRRTSGRRIGQDWYDERCRATSRVSLTVVEGAKEGKDSPSLASEVSIIHAAQTRQHESSNEKEENGQLLTPEATPEPDTKDAVEPEADDQHVRPQRDPVTWFGLFASQNLRATQSAFRSAIISQIQPDGEEEKSFSTGKMATTEIVESPVSRAVNASRALRLVEVEIRKQRKAIKAAKRIATAG